MAKDPAQRFGTGTELALAIAPLLGRPSYGAGDDVSSWTMGADITSLVHGARWTASPPAKTASPPAKAVAAPAKPTGKKPRHRGSSTGELIDIDVTTLLNLAACREKNGELASAWAWLVEAERQTRGKSGGERKLNQTAKERAAKLAVACRS